MVINFPTANIVKPALKKWKNKGLGGPNVCFACLRPWVLSIALQKKKKFLTLNKWFVLASETQLPHLRWASIFAEATTSKQRHKTQKLGSAHLALGGWKDYNCAAGQSKIPGFPMPKGAIGDLSLVRQTGVVEVSTGHHGTVRSMESLAYRKSSSKGCHTGECRDQFLSHVIFSHGRCYKPYLIFFSYKAFLWLMPARVIYELKS
jgi:hypothetical protein